MLRVGPVQGRGVNFAHEVPVYQKKKSPLGARVRNCGCLTLGLRVVFFLIRNLFLILTLTPLSRTNITISQFES